MWIIFRSKWESKDKIFVVKILTATGNLILDKEVTEVTEIWTAF